MAVGITRQNLSAAGLRQAAARSRDANAARRMYSPEFFEWGKIDYKMYARLASLLPDIGGVEIAKLFLEPDWEETSKLNDDEFDKK